MSSTCGALRMSAGLALSAASAARLSVDLVRRLLSTAAATRLVLAGLALARVAAL